MPLGTRYTVRLSPALDALVQQRIRTSGTPFAVLIQEALSAYLADTPPTGTPTPAPRAADSADTLRALQAQLAALTTRVETLEQAQPPLPTETPTDQQQPTLADTPQGHARGGQRKLTPRQVRALRSKRAGGAPIKALMKAYGLSKATVFRYLA
jgi:hypothetical protein